MCEISVPALETGRNCIAGANRPRDLDRSHLQARCITLDRLDWDTPNDVLREGCQSITSGRQVIDWLMRQCRLKPTSFLPVTRIPVRRWLHPFLVARDDSGPSSAERLIWNRTQKMVGREDISEGIWSEGNFSLSSFWRDVTQAKCGWTPCRNRCVDPRALPSSYAESAGMEELGPWRPEVGTVPRFCPHRWSVTRRRLSRVACPCTDLGWTAWIRMPFRQRASLSSNRWNFLAR